MKKQSRLPAHLIAPPIKDAVFLFAWALNFLNTALKTNVIKIRVNGIDHGGRTRRLY